jgi:hypothetical protein
LVFRKKDWEGAANQKEDCHAAAAKVREYKEGPNFFGGGGESGLLALSWLVAWLSRLISFYEIMIMMSFYERRL